MTKRSLKRFLDDAGMRMGRYGIWLFDLGGKMR